MICEEWDIVAVPFPFVDKTAAKRRPALALSKKTFNQNGHTVFAMITSSAHHPWPGDTEIVHREAAGLPVSCIVRLKLFTLDNRLIIKRVGRLSDTDRDRVAAPIRVHVI